MENKNNNSLNQLALAFLAGAAIGAILGVMFAPSKGKETRDQLSDSFSGLTDEIKNMFKAGQKEDPENKA